MVILITGRANAGKTHYAQLLVDEFIRNERPAMLVDGDRFRQQKDNNDFSDGGRIKNLMDAADFAATYEKKDIIMVLAFVAPKREWRDMMRAKWEQSRVVYIPGGKLWEGTTYEVPTEEEIQLRRNYGQDISK